MRPSTWSSLWGSTRATVIRRGVLSHTIARTFSVVRLNGELMNEVKLASAMAGHMGVPIGLVTGDDATCEEIEEWLPQVETAVVKYAMDTYAALCLPKEEAHKRIREGARRAVERVRSLQPVALGSVFRLEVDLLSPSAAQKPTLLPGVERTGNLTVQYVSENFEQVWRILWAMVFIGLTTWDPIAW